MLKAPTVFVLGAGAGCDIGMPLGDKLSRIIGEKLDIRRGLDDERGRGSGNADVENALKRYARTKNEQYNEFRAVGTSIKTGVQYTHSIDNFVNSHKDDLKLAVCAKLGILHTILEHENGCALWKNDSLRPFRDQPAVNRSWLVDFFYILLDQIIIAQNLGQFFKDLTIINFNYDRCIEQFLFYAIQDWSKRSEGVVAELFQSLKIYHPYGSIGPLPWQQSNGKRKVAFGGSYGGDDLDELVDQIKTYHEQVEQNDEVNLMRDALQKARNIIFLGFHFHKQNMDLIRVKQKPRSGGVPRVYATAKDRSLADIDLIKSRIREVLQRDLQYDLIYSCDGDCKALFREYQSTWIL